ncbi:MAG: zinc-ribbon domain-containing protein [Aquimonas sp.]|nr:zinc-ribbon domain-containing protein [Aquimonas sp.]
MPKRRADLVPHPRYGREPRVTGLDPQVDFPTCTVFLHWYSPSEVRVPNTAIAADTSRQNRPTIAVTHCFDSRRRCVDCRRVFLFFAAEQKYWYEVLGFPLESDCLRCVPCRKRQRELDAQGQRYEELFPLEDRTPDQDIEFVECSLALVAAGVFGRRPLERVRAILKKAKPHLKLQTVWERLREIEEAHAPVGDGQGPDLT